jgi:putative transposase
VNTIAAIMAEQHLLARPKRRRRGLTRADRSARKAPDLLHRDFAPPAQPNLAWVGDLTEIPNDEGPFYLASILDLHSRRAVGYAMDAHHDAQLATAALQVAIAVRGGQVAGVIFHSDQGGEYTADRFAAACTRAGVRQSMGRTGSALDNAVAESFNSTLEFELLAHSHFATRVQARAAVAAWIEEYNTTGCIPPRGCCRRPSTRPGPGGRRHEHLEGSGFAAADVLDRYRQVRHGQPRLSDARRGHTNRDQPSRSKEPKLHDRSLYGFGGWPEQALRRLASTAGHDGLCPTSPIWHFSLWRNQVRF